MNERTLRGLSGRIKSLITHGVLVAANDLKGVQTLRVRALFGEERPEVRRVQNYGFTSVPLPGAELTLICSGGDRGGMVCIATDDRQGRKKNMLPGESAMYNAFTGAFVALLNSGIAVLDSTVIMLGSGTETNGVVRMSDLQAVVAAFNAHTHVYVPATSVGAPLVPMPAATASTSVFCK